MKHGTHTNKVARLNRREIRRQGTTERPVAELGNSRPSKHFSQRVCQLEISRDTYKLCEPTLVVFSDEHIAEVKMLATIMAAVVAGELLAAFVVLKNLRRFMLGEAKVSKQSPKPHTVF